MIIEITNDPTADDCCLDSGVSRQDETQNNINTVRIGSSVQLWPDWTRFWITMDRFRGGWSDSSLGKTIHFWSFYYSPHFVLLRFCSRFIFLSRPHFLLNGPRRPVANKTSDDFVATDVDLDILMAIVRRSLGFIILLGVAVVLKKGTTTWLVIIASSSSA